MNLTIRIMLLVVLLLAFNACNSKKENSMSFNGSANEVKLITLDPGHFHAALVQKENYKQVSPIVYIYAPDDSELNGHLNRIEKYNSRKSNPTSWESIVYKGKDFFNKMISDKAGNVIITSGNNQKRTEYIHNAIKSGINVLADKPMCIDKDGFELIKESFEIANENGALLYDIMTERSEITTILQKELIKIPEVFGTIVKGSIDNPSIVKHSVHHFSKIVSGAPLTRLAWFFDASQQGDGLVDVTTHLVDLVQWELFPEQILDYKKDVEITKALHWPTKLSLQQFSKVTKLESFPDYLKSNVDNNLLAISCNGEINYKLKGISSKVVVEWKYEAEDGGRDTHYSIIRGTKTNIIIKQSKEENYIPELFIEGVNSENNKEINSEIEKSITQLQKKYPGINVTLENNLWHISIPQEYRIGHEAHFGQVMKRYLDYLVEGKLPKWEIQGMITKYFTTTKALELANSTK